MLLTDHFDILFVKLSQSEKFVIYGCLIDNDSVLSNL